MNEQEYRDSIGIVITAARLLTYVDIPAILKLMDMAETLAPLLHPTLWSENGQAMNEDRQIFQAALPLWEMAKTLRNGGEP